MNKEFFLALEDLVELKGMDMNMLIETMENALAIAYKRQHNVQGTVRIKMNPEKYSVKFCMVKTIVHEVTDPDNEISLEEAKTHKKSYKLGDTYEQEFIPKQFSRIAAQTAKQVVMQKLREAERDNTIAEFEDKENEIQNCIVRRIENKTVFVEIGGGQIEGLLLPQDQVPTETYNVNDMIKVYVKRVRNDGRNAQILVSRTAPGLVRKLFENEVPEIKQGLVQIKAIAREAGARTKIAIHSTDPNLDAVGACVGQKGCRVNAVVNELRGEKIDIILWSEDPLEFIAKALSPAKVLMVTAIEGEKVAKVIVPDDKLSLAIGKDGQNARLAARLTGWKVDVKNESKARVELGYNPENLDDNGEDA
ncbi:MAG: transcription termination/antitermination protein NusA [Clostridia bacterium]|nr:transcription termination/antitermination protein NusA [Clostridia bacterium]